MLTPERMTAMLAALALGGTLSQAKSDGLVQDDADLAYWRESAKELEEIHARGLQVELLTDQLL